MLILAKEIHVFKILIKINEIYLMGNMFYGLDLNLFHLYLLYFTAIQCLVIWGGDIGIGTDQIISSLQYAEWRMNDLFGQSNKQAFCYSTCNCSFF